MVGAKFRMVKRLQSIDSHPSLGLSFRPPYGELKPSGATASFSGQRDQRAELAYFPSAGNATNPCWMTSAGLASMARPSRSKSLYRSRQKRSGASSYSTGLSMR